jgi:nucleoside-diphosphate-sugar epimerase
MRFLVTGGAGFIGRWVVRRLLERSDAQITVLDNYSNSSPSNLDEFNGDERLTAVRGDVADEDCLRALWRSRGPFDVVFHLAASIRVQDSIDSPRPVFVNDVVGTFEILERCRFQFFEANGIDPAGAFHLLDVEPLLRRRKPKVVFASTCMVYAPAPATGGISESHQVRPSSPYAASKIAAENLVLSYGMTYRLPVTVVRPFNTYGPFQKSNLEGGVVAIFIARDLARKPLLVKGDGTQTRDLLYVEDSAAFIVAAGLSDRAEGQVLNAGLGSDVSVNALAALVTDPSNGGNGSTIERVPHDHPQAEIAKLLCDCRRAEAVLGWKPKVGLAEGIRWTREWIRAHPGTI